MILRTRLDISWTDFSCGLAASVLPQDGPALERRIRSALPGGDDAILCMSVRSGFDALLGALALPRGSEVLLTAVTIPDMLRIVRGHGLVPVPVDVDPDTLQPDPAALARAASERSRVMVAAHLFGAVSDFGDARAFARERGLLFVEDCAQSHIPGRFYGDEGSDVRMISFGPIKTDTAMGGGVLFVRDPTLRARIREILDAHPVQRRGVWVRRLLKYGALQAMNGRAVFWLFRAGCRLAGADFDTVLREAARGFRGRDLLARLRHRPAGPLLALLARRLRRPGARVAARTAAGEELARELDGEVLRPGGALAVHTHWLFPVLADDATALMVHLRKCGFDATSGASSLAAVSAPPERPDAVAPVAEFLMARILFVPAYPEAGVDARKRLAEALKEWSARHPLPAMPGAMAE